MRKESEKKLLWHWLAIVYVWHIGGDVDDETAYVALSRLKKWVDEALGLLESEPSAEKR